MQALPTNGVAEHLEINELNSAGGLILPQKGPFSRGTADSPPDSWFLGPTEFTTRSY